MKCGQNIKNTTAGAQLVNHLRNKHLEDYEEYEASKADDFDADDLKDPKFEPTVKKKGGRKKRSKIWSYFKTVEPAVETETDDYEGETVACNECGHHIHVAKQSRGTTSPMINHLKHSHAQLYSVFE